MNLLQIVLLQQPGEERLREILRVLRRTAQAPDVGVERMPVGTAETFQGGRGLG